MQDIEFTIEQGKLYMLQCRNGKRTGFAGVRIAVDMVDEKLITPKEALLRVEPEQLNQLLRPIFDCRREEERAVARGPAARQGPQRRPGRRHRQDRRSTPTTPRRWRRTGEQRDPGAHRDLARGHPRHERRREGILTARGGMTSHAALVGRQMGKVCIVGCDALSIDYHAGDDARRPAATTCSARATTSRSTASPARCSAAAIATKPSEVVQVLIDKTLDAEAGADLPARTRKLMEWADEAPQAEVRTNADQPDQATQASPSAPRASACAAPSTCSSARARSARCAR